MANTKTTGLGAFTPVLADLLYGVDDPGGTPVSGKMTITALRDLIQVNLTKMITADAGELTISGGAITATGSYHTVDTESDASSDNLDTINGGTDGMRIILQAENAARTISITRAGNINAEYELRNAETAVTLIYSGALSKWVSTVRIDKHHGAAYDEGNTDAFVVDTTAQITSYHTNGLVTADEHGWTFDAGGAGTSFPIASVADGADTGVDIAVTTTGSHLLAAGAIVSHTGLADAAYRGVFVVKAVINATKYEVAAVYTATGTGTMNEAFTFTAGTGSDGEHRLDWSASVTSQTNNETFDFQWFINATAIPGSTVRRKFGTGGDVGAISGMTPTFAVVSGDKISMVLTNTNTAGNITIRNFTAFIGQK